MNKSESKYFHTAERMDEALLSLLLEKDFEYITVKDVCARAGANRSPFTSIMRTPPSFFRRLWR